MVAVSAQYGNYPRRKIQRFGLPILKFSIIYIPYNQHLNKFYSSLLLREPLQKLHDFQQSMMLE